MNDAPRSPAAGEAQAPIVLRARSLASLESSQGLSRLIPAWIISGIVHLLVLAAFLITPYGAAEGDTPDMSEVAFDTQVGDDSLPPNLENDEIGLDPSVTTNYNVDRIEEV